MGQGQSGGEVLKGEGVDFSQVRLRAREKKPMSRTNRTVKRAKPDEYMALVSVTDHIKPIREAETPREEEEAIEGVVEVARQLREAKKKKDEPLDLKVLELPEAPSEPSSPSSEDEEDHGLFHSEVQWPTADMSPLREAAHPVSIEGEFAVDCVLGFRDLSPFAAQFPVYKIEWVESLNLGDSRVFSVVPLAAGGPDTPLKLSNELLGKIVAVKAYRRVEDQLAASKLAALEGGAYDQHTGIISPGGAKALPAFVEVVSRAAGGPVLLSAAEASACLKAFARGGFSCAVLLRDILDERERAVPLEATVKASAATKKIPASLIVEKSFLELRFLKSYIGEDENGILRQLEKQPFQSEQKQTAEREDDFAVIRRALDEIYVRPSKGRNTIVVSLELTGGELQSALGRQPLLRFDVDPAVGRDSCLLRVLAFQALNQAGVEKVAGEEWLTHGNFGPLREAFQKFLQDQTRASPERPAFEKMPTTPWAILNYRE